MFVAGILASIACGIIGTYIVVKRLVFISGGIAHTSFGGIGLAYWLSFEPMIGAVIFSVVTAIIVGISSLRTKIREDSTIGILWVIGMALGIIFLRWAPKKVDLGSVLFGNILFVPETNLWLMLGLIVIILLLVTVFYKEFLALCFDEEFAKISGVRTGPLYILLLCLVALTVVLLLKVVGVILVIALLTIPAAMAGLFTHDMKRMMGLAIVFGLLFTMTGLILSLETNQPPGALIVLVAGVFFLVAMAGKYVRDKVRTSEGAERARALKS
jgi:zinc transport system permease protein